MMKKIDPMAFGLVIGVVISFGVGIAMDNLGLGLCFGLPIGVAIGATQKKKQNDEGSK